MDLFVGKHRSTNGHLVEGTQSHVSFFVVVCLSKAALAHYLFAVTVVLTDLGIQVPHDDVDNPLWKFVYHTL